MAGSSSQNDLSRSKILAPARYINPYIYKCFSYYRDWYPSTVFICPDSFWLKKVLWENLRDVRRLLVFFSCWNICFHPSRVVNIFTLWVITKTKYFSVFSNRWNIQYFLSDKRPEQSIAAARASVMVYDDINKKWVPAGSSHGLSKVEDIFYWRAASD